jgi:hypothetical protein
MMSGADEEATMLSTACNQILGTILAFAHHIPPLIMIFWYSYESSIL